MTAPTYLLDQRGVPDLTKRADLYCIGATAKSRPTLGNPKGRVIVSFQPALLMNGETPADFPYNNDIAAAATKFGARTGLVNWEGPGDWHSEVIDITKARMGHAIVQLWRKHFSWANGLIIDPCCPFTWQFSQLAPIDARWNQILTAIINDLRVTYRQLVIGQQFDLVAPVTATNGEFWENTPEYNGMSMLKHSQDVASFLANLKTFSDPRETVFVTQVREPWRCPPGYVDSVKAWAADPGAILGKPGSIAPFYLCLGQDATAVGAA